MELKEFIKEVVKDVVNSIVELDTELKETGAVISPKNVKYKGEGLYERGDIACVHQILFNVAVETTTEKEKSGGIQIKVVGGSIGNSERTNQCTEIRFSLPVIYPSYDVKWI